MFGFDAYCLQENIRFLPECSEECFAHGPQYSLVRQVILNYLSLLYLITEFTHPCVCGFICVWNKRSLSAPQFRTFI